MIFAINLRTESGDSCMLLKEVGTETEMLAEVVLSMDTELAHVYEWEIATIGGDIDEMSCLIDDHIEIMRNENRDFD